MTASLHCAIQGVILHFNVPKKMKVRNMTFIPQWMRSESNIGVVNIVAIFTRVLLCENTRTSLRMAEVGSHVTPSCSVIGPFQTVTRKREI